MWGRWPTTSASSGPSTRIFQSTTIHADDEHRLQSGWTAVFQGSWPTYWLGTENKNFRVRGAVSGRADPVGPPLWNNAFLPAINQGTYIPDKIEAHQSEEELIERSSSEESSRTSATRSLICRNSAAKWI